MTAVSRAFYNLGTMLKDFGERFGKKHPKGKFFANWLIRIGYKIRGKA